jgi:hypothetical protein
VILDMMMVVGVMVMLMVMLMMLMLMLMICMFWVVWQDELLWGRVQFMAIEDRETMRET